MIGAFSMLAALGALTGGGPDARPWPTPDPRPKQTPKAAVDALERAAEKRIRKAAQRRLAIHRISFDEALEQLVIDVGPASRLYGFAPSLRGDWERGSGAIELSAEESGLWLRAWSRGEWKSWTLEDDLGAPKKTPLKDAIAASVAWLDEMEGRPE